MATKSLPPGQRRVFEFIKSYAIERGYPPSLGEIAEGLGLTSRSTIHQHVHALHKKGLLEIGGVKQTRKLKVVE